MVIGLLQVLQVGLLHRLIYQVADVLDYFGGGQARLGSRLMSMLHFLDERQVELGWLAIFEERVLLVGVRREHHGGIATPSVSLGRHGGLREDVQGCV